MLLLFLYLERSSHIISKLFVSQLFSLDPLALNASPACTLAASLSLFLLAPIIFPQRNQKRTQRISIAHAPLILSQPKRLIPLDVLARQLSQLVELDLGSAEDVESTARTTTRT